MRPNIVWFGEIPFHLDQIYSSLEECDVFVSIGTSNQVYPAAGFAQVAKSSGALCIVCNMESTSTSHLFDERFIGPATKEEKTTSIFLRSLF